MILRVLTLLVGTPLFLIGLLAIVVAIGMVGDPGPRRGQLPIAAQQFLTARGENAPDVEAHQYS